MSTLQIYLCIYTHIITFCYIIHMYRYVVYILYVVYSFTCISYLPYNANSILLQFGLEHPGRQKNLHPGIRSFVDLAAQLCSVDAAFGEAVRASPPGQNSW